MRRGQSWRLADGRFIERSVLRRATFENGAKNISPVPNE